jgi:hypothetical protein
MQDLVVSAVWDVGGARTLSISEHQMRNELVAGQYADFGDDGRQKADVADLIQPSYAALTADIAPDGVHFRSKVKGDLPVCDVTISARGRFHLLNNGPQVLVEWDEGPNVGITMPILCEIAGVVLEPLRIAARIAAESFVAGKVAGEVQEEVDHLIAQLSGGGPNPALFIQRFEAREDELLVVLNIPGEHVAIEVPYGRLRLDEAASLGLPLFPGEQVLIMASGLTDVCILGGGPPQGCERKKTGPAGLFNWSANVPVPTPWPCSDNGTCAYFEERHQAHKRLEGYRREPFRLPFPGQNVGALVARTANATSASSYLLADGPCTITPGPGLDRLAFGANDHRYVGAAELGSGTRRVSVTWSPPTAGLDCAASTFSVAGLLQELGTSPGTVVQP